jgi:hypothetical protein
MSLDIAFNTPGGKYPTSPWACCSTLIEAPALLLVLSIMAWIFSNVLLEVTLFAADFFVSVATFAMEYPPIGSYILNTIS